MQAFLLKLILAVVSDPKFEQNVKDLIGQLITERILPLVPLAVGAATKAAVDEVIKVMPGAEGVIKDIVSIEHTTEAARAELDSLIPNIILPTLSELQNFWRPKQ